MMTKFKLIGTLLFISLVLAGIPVFSVTMPGSLRIYVGVDTSYSNYLAACTNVQNPSYASNDTIFSIENVCFYTNYTNYPVAGFVLNSTTYGINIIDAFTFMPGGYPIYMFEYRPGANVLKEIFYSLDPLIYGPNRTFAYEETRFIETNPTGYIKLLFDVPGTYRIRYLAVDKAIGPDPIILFGPVYIKEQVYNEPPRVVINSPKLGTLLVNTNVVTLSFTAEDPEGQAVTCYYSVGGRENAVSLLSGETVNITLTVDYIGNTSISVICRDPYGATGSAFTYIIRESPPSVVIITPYDNQLITNRTLPIVYMVSDNGPYVVCNLSVMDYYNNVLTSKIENISLPSTGINYKHTYIDLSSIPDGRTYILSIVCNDNLNLQASTQIRFEYATDPDKSQRYCTSLGGEWYGGHCCGDDYGEATSRQAKGWPTPEAFDPATCSIIQLSPGQCDDNSDCPPSGWFCTNETTRELRQYQCYIPPGQKIGNCVVVTQRTETCPSGQICSNGVCSTQQVANKPPMITILYPSEGELINVTNATMYIPVNFTVTDDNSNSVVCNITINNKIETIGSVNISDIVTYNVSIVNGTNTVSITCIDAYNATSTSTVRFKVNKLPVECVVDTDCGINSWQCISQTERAYVTYKCEVGKCLVNITAVELAPTGYICMDGSLVPENTLRCTTDADCPPSDNICTADKTGVIHRKWYCDTTAGVCKYNIVGTTQCSPTQTCIAGRCWEKGGRLCEGLMLSYCTSNTTYQQLVSVYKDEIGTCVYVPVGVFSCPEGTTCFAGKCSVQPTGNLPPVINITLLSTKVKVKEALGILVTVYDDSPVVFVNVTAFAPEPIIIFKGPVLSGKQLKLFYVPPHASEHTILVEAVDQYGVTSTSSVSVTVEEVTTTAPTTAPPTAPPTGAGVTAPAGGAPSGVGLPSAAAIAKPSELPPEILIILLIGIGGGIAVFLLTRRR